MRMFAAEGCLEGEGREEGGAVCKGCAIKFALLFAAAFPVRDEARRHGACRVAFHTELSRAECAVAA